MRKTPETDAVAHQGLCESSYIAQMTELSRKLERERDEAIAQRDEQVRLTLEVDRLRAQAKRERDAVINALDETINCCHDEPCTMLVFRLYRERDEAREELERYEKRLSEEREFIAVTGEKLVRTTNILTERAKKAERENAKLRDIAERLADELRDLANTAFDEILNEFEELKLKEGGK